MHDSTTLSDEHIERLADIMANDPTALDRLATKLAEKVGDRLFQAGFDLTGVNEKLDQVIDTQRQQGELLNTMHGNIQNLRGRVDLTNREVRKVNNRIDSIDAHLGINTDSRRTA